MRCTARRSAGRGSAVILGLPYADVSFGNASYNSGTGAYQIDAAVQNLSNEALGTPGGTYAAPEGIRVFFESGPRVTAGSGSVSVLPDGYDVFTAAGQAYFAYYQIVAGHDSSSARRWTFLLPPTVASFDFTVLIAAEVPYLLVINEVMTNPGGTIADADGEWFEVYNAGSRAVGLQGLLIADSAASGRRPYHTITSSITVPAGGYVVLGATSDTTLSGGVPVDYAYGTALALASTLDAIKISRVYGTDTLTIDRASYANATISAQNGISRELINPLLDNADIDGSNWADASTTAVYGSGGRGTPGAQNSAFVP